MLFRSMYVMARIWSNVFWGECEDRAVAANVALGYGRRAPLMTISTAVVVALSVAIMIWAGPLYEFSERAAFDLLHPATYVDAVLGQSG